jgi:hypothetical protein
LTSARFYLLAFGAGVVGVALGAFLGTGTSGLEFQTHRLVYSHLNLVGLVGFSIIGTIPTFPPPSHTTGPSAAGKPFLDGDCVSRRQHSCSRV